MVSYQSFNHGGVGEIIDLELRKSELITNVRMVPEKEEVLVT